MSDRQLIIIFPFMLMAWLFSMLAMCTAIAYAITALQIGAEIGNLAYLIIPLAVFIQRITVRILKDI